MSNKFKSIIYFFIFTVYHYNCQDRNYNNIYNRENKVGNKLNIIEQNFNLNTSAPIGDNFVCDYFYENFDMYDNFYNHLNTVRSCIDLKNKYFLSELKILTKKYKKMTKEKKKMLDTYDEKISTVIDRINAFSSTKAVKNIEKSIYSSKILKYDKSTETNYPSLIIILIVIVIFASENYKIYSLLLILIHFVWSLFN